MTQFQYIARNDRGTLMRGVLEAPSRLAVQVLLSQRGERPVSISPMAERSRWLTKLQDFSWRDCFGPRSFDVEVALQQLALMHRSGLGLVASLQSVAEQTRSKAFQKIAKGMIEDVQSGNSLHEAMQKHTVFPRVLVQLIEVGEATGELADVMERGAKQMSQHRKRKSAIATMLAYPSFIMTAAMSVSIYLVLVVIPKLQTFLTAMGRPLPAMTQSLLTFSQKMQTLFPTICIVGLALVGCAYAVYRHPQGRLWMDRGILSIPVLGTIIRLSGTIAFSSTLGAMLRSGVSLVQALAAIESIHANRYFAAKVATMRRAVIGGQALSSPLSKSTVYMPMLAQMVAIAERTGKTEEVLEQVTMFYEEQLQSTTKRLGAMMEPLLIVFIGGFIGYVYMAFFVALMSAGGSGR